MISTPLSDVLLVHGMARTALSLRRLAGYLRRAGYRPKLLYYVAAIESFERIVERVHRCLSQCANSGRPYAAVGHSLGGLLIRAALAREPRLPLLPAHVILLGTPNQTPRLARRFARLWPYRWVNGDSGQVLARAESFRIMPPLPVPYTILAGTGGRRGRLSFFGDEPNDGTVALSETLLHQSDAPRTFPVRHTFMMNDPRVRATIVAALESNMPQPREAR